MTIDGQDWARYQAAAPATKGLAFVFIKVTEGTSYTNPKWKQQRDHARAAGLLVGYYHFARGVRNIAEADYFLHQTGPLASGEMLAFDWEDSDVSNAEKDAWIRYVQGKVPGHRVGLYANRAYWLGRDDTSVCGDFLWIADPSAPKGQPRVEHPWVFHQYSEAGGVDHNVSNFTTAAALRAWATGTVTPQEDPMAGMTEKAVATAVWKTDNILPAGSTEPDPKNTGWVAETYLTRTFENTVKLLAKEAAQTAAIAKLAGLVGSNVDTAAVVAAVQAAIADAVINVHVDVTGEPTS